MQSKRYHTSLAVSLLLLIGLATADVFSGSVHLNFQDLAQAFRSSGPDFMKDILWNIRLPRLATALLTGACMALAGLQMQAVFQNSLADPHIMGVSSGAGLGAAIASILLGTAGATGLRFLSGMTIVTAAFAGATLSTLILLPVSRKCRTTETLLLFGVILGFIFSALTSILAYSANSEVLKTFYSWSAGSFLSCNHERLLLLLLALLTGLLLALWNHRGLDLILFGDPFTRFAGGNLSTIRTKALLSACILTAAVTAFCGPIGFVGIVAPHLARNVYATSVHRNIFLPTLLFGAILALCADILSQAWKTPLPVGSTIALIGIPIILYILLKNHAGNK